MAWRDGKASGKRLLLFMASILLGIAAVVSIQSFSQNLKENIGLQSKALMGADYLIDSNQPANARVQQLMDSLGGADAMEVKFASMAAFNKNGATKLVQVRGVEGDFPFYGALETEPADAATTYQERGGALVDATAMLQFNLKPGDSVKLGTLTFPIIGSLVTAPGSTGIGTSVAPPVMVPYRFMQPSGLLQKGSRLAYNYYFLDPDADLEALDETVDPLLDEQNADMDTHTATSQRLGRRYDNVGRFLNLVAFIALLLGCVGIASSVHIYIKEKLKAVAILKCLGASRKQTFLIFLLQIAGMGLLGGLIGTLAGLLLQQSFPLLLQEFLPFDVTISTSYAAIITGLLLGIIMSVLFALSPLINTWYVSPLAVLRVQERTGEKSRWANFGVLAVIVLFVFLFAYWLLGNFKFALGFVTVVLVTFAILGGVAVGFMKLIKRLFPKSWTFTSRQSLLNLFRPNNQTAVLILAIGIGTFLISTLYFTKDFLLAKTSLESSNKSPNMILFDVQTEQKLAVANTITPKGMPVLENIPIITMRLEKIKERSVNAIRLDTTTGINKWILNHEFRVTYRDSLIGSEKLVSGNFGAKAGPDQPIPISLSDNVARDAQVVLGDTLLFNVQGMLMETVVGSIRQVDWGRMQLNFSIVFPTGVLEKAPQFHVLTTNAPSKKASASLQRELVQRFPNVSILDLRQVITLVEGILDKIAWVISFMAFFSMLTGIIVLIGAVRNSKYQRIRESVLLRTLGAKSHQILKITALEYLYLGLLGSGVGILLSLVSSQLLAYFVFDTSFVPSLVPFLVVLPGVTLLVLAIGMSNSSSVLKSPPLQVLRKEAS
ncbi:FtsX-like permease family protein [Maribacter sp. MJ134]|uniref:ABC transporter permease n=1 Tax=Maribacter sp. MJ134 TaxID=2496865 RepID=UPI000F824190|nr:FtsX-like permease family protein [Maribacter sp. MJ134]AZQ58702.1 FtsX-like permease family protein [Maribacter sp. MJ134]